MDNQAAILTKNAFHVKSKILFIYFIISLTRTERTILECNAPKIYSNYAPIAEKSTVQNNRDRLIKTVVLMIIPICWAFPSGK